MQLENSYFRFFFFLANKSEELLLSIRFFRRIKQQKRLIIR